MRLRTASVIGVVACFIIFLSMFRFATRLIELHAFFPRARVGILVDGVLLALATVSLLYSIYALYEQSRFFKRWGRRFESLEIAERKLLGEEHEV